MKTTGIASLLGEPSLVVSGEWPENRIARVLVPLAFPALAVAGLLVWLPGVVRGTQLPLPEDALRFGVLFWLVASLGLACLSIWLFERHLLAREGEARFHETGILLLKPGRGRRFIAWAELEGFDDGGCEIVHLHVGGVARREPALAIPTRTMIDRTLVLAELDRRGLRRRES